MKPEFIQRQEIITGERIVLRPFQTGDAALVAQYANDQRVAQMTTSIPFPLSFDAAKAFVERSTDPERDEDVWVIDGTPAGAAEVLGVISLKNLNPGQSEVGYWVAPEFWNNGYASEAVKTLVDFNPHASGSVVASVFKDNAASAKVLSGNGFAWLGEAEAFCLSRAAHVPTWTYLKAL